MSAAPAIVTSGENSEVIYASSLTSGSSSTMFSSSSPPLVAFATSSFAIWTSAESSIQTSNDSTTPSNTWAESPTSTGSESTITPKPDGIQGSGGGASPTSESDPTVSLDPDPTASPDLGAGQDPDASREPTTWPPAYYSLILSSGTCADVGVPRVMSDKTGEGMPLISLDNGQYGIVLQSDASQGSGATIYLPDSGERCGEQGNCASIILGFSGQQGLTMLNTQAGDRGVTMYPFSMWADGGELYDGTRADSRDTKYNCWGWSQQSCPFSHKFRGDPNYAMRTSMFNSTAHIEFCPSDGPPLSSIGQNPNPPSKSIDTHGTVIIGTIQSTITSSFLSLLTADQARPTPVAPNDECAVGPAASCARSMPYTSTDQSSTTTLPEPTSYTVSKVTGSASVVPVATVALEPGGSASLATLYSTFFVIEKTSTIQVPNATTTRLWPGSSLHARPTGSTMESGWGVVRTTVTDSSGGAVTTSITTGPVVPASLSSRTTPSPAPTPADNTFILSSWTTYIVLNGSTVPAVGGQVGIRTVVSEVYRLEPSTTILVAALSSASVESIRTSVNSPTAAVVRLGSSVGTKIAGVVVGVVVGLGLLGICAVMHLHRRKQSRAPDYASYRPPVFGSTGQGSSAAPTNDSVDLASEPGPHESYIEPWVQPLPGPISRKMQREMEERGALISGPSRDARIPGASLGGDFHQPRSSKPTLRVPLVLPTQVQDGPPSDRSSPALRPTPTPNPAPLSTPLLAASAQSPPPSQQPSPFIIPRREYTEEPSEDARHLNAIPPRYNEAWNIPQPPSH